MKKIILIFAMTFIFVGFAQAQKSSGFGLDYGAGAPFTMQVGLNYQANDTWGLGVSYNSLDLMFADVGLKLKMPELLLTYHPFKGSYFIGLGFGQETLTASAGVIGVNLVSIEVEAITTVVKTGWKWGLANGGFWFGVDLSFISPSSPQVTITAPGVPTNDPDYIDAQDVAKKFGEISYINLTFARLGYIF